jgi:hypothetical protein
MAFFQDQDEEELNNPEQGGGVATSQASGLVGQGAQAQGTQSAPSANPSANTPDNPGNFVGIKSYLDANKNQASKLGDQASGVINNSAQGARDAVGGLNSTFNEKAGGPAVFNPEVNQKVGLGAEKLSAEEKGQVKSQYNAQYKGPMDLTDTSLQPQYVDAQKKLNTAKTNVQSSGTEEGRKGLITQINEKPRTAGINNFDNILLQSGTGREKLAQTASANKDVTEDILGTANQTAAQKAQANKLAADTARTQTQKAVGDASGAFQKQFDQNDPMSRLSQAISSGLKLDTIGADVNNNAWGMDQATLDSLGIQGGLNTYGVDSSKYFKQGDPSSINAGTLASAEDYARSAALAELAGGQSFLNQADIGKSGTAKLSSYDTEGFKNAISSKGKKYDEMNKDLSVVTNPKYNSVLKQIVNPDLFPQSTPVGLRTMQEKISSFGNTPKDLLKAREYFTARTPLDPTGKAGLLVTSIDKYLASLDKHLTQKYTVKKNQESK